MSSSERVMSFDRYVQFDEGAAAVSTTSRIR